MRLPSSILALALAVPVAGACAKHPAAPPPVSAPAVYEQAFETLPAGHAWLHACKWDKHASVAAGCGIVGQCLRITHDPDCREPALFPLPPLANRPAYPAQPPCRVCSPNYTNTGTDVVQAVQPLPPADEYSLSYDLYFERGYDWARGGKLPGLTAKEWDSGCTTDGDGQTRTRGPARWSVRVMWLAGGGNELYVYDQDRLPGACGAERPTSVRFTTGRWYAVTVYVRLNTAPAARDGEAALYIDGELARQETGIRYRAETTPASQIQAIFFSTFFGGNEARRLYCLRHSGEDACKVGLPATDVTWVPAHASRLRFDNVAVYAGRKVRARAGR